MDVHILYNGGNKMLTLEEINQEVDKFNKFVNYISVPYVQNLVYDDTMGALGKVKYDDLSQDKYIIYLSPAINKFSLKRQKSIVWHELTHILDYCAYKDKYDIKALLKSYSETHATNVEFHYLTNTSLIQKVNDTNIIVDWDENRKKIVDINAEMLDLFLRNMILFSESGEPGYLDQGINNFLYFCGSIAMQSKAKNILAMVMSNYPAELFKTEFVQLGNAVLHKNISLAILSYVDIFALAADFSLKKIL